MQPIRYFLLCEYLTKLILTTVDNSSNVKGQAAIEYMMVLGIALIITAPFVVKAQNSVVDIRSSVSVIETQNTLNNMDVAVRTVDAAGQPAARTIEFRLPGNTNRTVIEDRRITVFLNTPTGEQRLSRSFDAELSGSIPDQPGLYLLRIQADQGEVNMEVVS